jgi:hypothetical protein
MSETLWRGMTRAQLDAAYNELLDQSYGTHPRTSFAAFSDISKRHEHSMPYADIHARSATKFDIRHRSAL